jgi:LysR family transcriptional regulator, nitrogen assimilation regulatory protein
MTLAQLSNFIRIAELKSLSKAAAALRIAQPALSRQIRSLEHELGSTLLVRHAWGVTLTSAGEILLERARRVLLESDGARDAILTLSAEPRGRVALGIPTSLAKALIPPLARNLREKYPKLRPHFMDGFSAGLHARTLAGELDLAILYDDRAIGPLAATPLLTEPLMLIGPRNKTGEATLSALHKLPLVLPARPNRLRLIFDQLAALGPGEDADIVEVDSFSALIALVQQGDAHTLLPFSSVRDDVERGSLTASHIENAEAWRVMLLVRPLGRQPSAAIRVVEHELFSVVSSLAHTHRWRSLGKID